ncbi:undecaprenyl-diphosphatase UppP [Bacteroidales bacterium KA00251]|nr:undecaprenyl-diphosphatase UppP [Bacteroidales bacterium KA00251]
MTLTEAIILAIVEGLTEFLPISSTGHMILAQGIMGMESTAFIRSFTVIIQLGAILSVVVLYWRRFFTIKGATSITEVNTKTDSSTTSQAQAKFSTLLRFYLLLILGCIPAAILGLLFEHQIDNLLSNVYVVATMLLVGGIFMIFIDKLFNKSNRNTIKPKNALVVGLFQCIAMIPGVSRSMATIVGGLQQKLTRKVAAEFSFFIAVPTMFGATVLKAYKLYKEFGTAIFVENATLLIIGNIVAFVVALLAIRFFIAFLTKYGFRAFGWYRIIVGALILVLLFMGLPLAVA